MTTRLEPPKLPRWLAAQLPFSRYVVPIENHHMHVMECGHGPRVVLCVHGNPTWGYLYRKVAAELDPEKYRVVMPDLVGLGYSSRPAHTAAHTLVNHARWMGKFIEYMNFEDYILVGQDWGGPIGLLGASRAGSAAGLVLLNTVVSPPRPGFKSTAFHSFAQAPGISELAFRMAGFPQNMLWTAQGDRRSIRGEVARAYKAPLRGLSRNAAPLALARMVPDNEEHTSVAQLEQVREFVTSFDGPIAGVWGENDPILGGVGRYVEKLLPDIRMVVTSAGHFLQEEVPRPIADAVDWVNRQV